MRIRTTTACYSSLHLDDKEKSSTSWEFRASGAVYNLRAFIGDSRSALANPPDRLVMLNPIAEVVMEFLQHNVDKILDILSPSASVPTDGVIRDTSRVVSYKIDVLCCANSIHSNM